MKEKLKRSIYDVLDLLMERDPAWRQPKMLPKFRDLYFGWRAAELRNNIHSHLFYTKSWRRNWLPVADWVRFRDYAMQ